MACMCELHAHSRRGMYVCTLLSLIQAMLAGPRGLLVFVVAHVGGRALLWPPGNARVPRTAVLERKPAQKTAPVLLVARPVLLVVRSLLD